MTDYCAANLRWFQFYAKPGAFWFRIFGYGVAGKDTRKHRLMFSERNGITKHLMIGRWSFVLLK